MNAAAHTAVDRAESEPELARTINSVAPGVIAGLTKATGAWLVHYSTDYVFDGSGTTPWTETDAFSPLNVYGTTKLEGEHAIRDSGCKHLIFRTSWVYAARGGNFAKTMLKLAKERETLSVIDDQIGAPTGADFLADVTAHAIRQVTVSPEHASSLSGTYNAAAQGHTSWHGYAQLVVETALSNGVALRVGSHAIAAVASDAFPTAAARPRNSRLNTSKLQSTFGLTPPPWQDGVIRMLAEII